MGKKSLLKNYFFNATYSLLSVIIPIITIPYISRILLANGVGQVSYAQNIVSYFVLVASLGIPSYGIREVAKKAADIEQRSNVFWEIFSINLLSTAVATITYYVSIGLFACFQERKTLLAVVGISLILNAFNIDWFYKGIEEFQYITIRSYIIKIVSLFAIFIFVRTADDVLCYAFISTTSVSANYLLNIVHVRKYIHKPRIKELKLSRHLKSIFFMFATALAVDLYTQLDTTMVGAICGETYVGYYTNAMKLTKIVIIVITAIGTVLLPRLSAYYAEHRIAEMSSLASKAVEYILFIALPCSLGLFIISDDVVKVLFGVDFLPAIPTLQILALLIPIISVGNIFGSQLLITLNLEKLMTVTVVIGATVNISLNSVLIKQFQQNGAAIASVIAEFCVLVAQICLTRKSVRVKVNPENLCKTILQCVAMAAIIFGVRWFSITGVIRLLLEVVMGGTVYFAIGFLCNNRLLIELFGKVKVRMVSRKR